MSEASVPDQSERISGKPIGLASNEVRNVDTSDPVSGWHRVRQYDTCLQPVLEWRGPIAFARAYGTIPGIDHDFGTRWGSNGDQRVSLRVELGCEQGLLYAYDPTWDEYAVIGAGVPLAAVETAFARALQFGEHGGVEDLVALLARVSSFRTAVGPEL